ncbi:hypothetical protein HELRODRAFT_67964 [Helobdella robusta]|uniref:Peptidase metallopeptidase domain-containing protein n=1 Tax=Helobdella robusta TaxID=6412 RepID=T1FZ86_HELRO|nr:hypothetical protein HELRODRAFT_67964 [Helobdella robusta]ESN96714.1 hypothetical protein HELRODRAFT_67964 [Helobdella robusta]
MTTGKLDEATLKLMNSPRCHLPDFPAPHNNKGKRFAWRKTKLTYNINNFPTSSSDMQDPNNVGQAIQTAFNDWTSVAILDVQRSSATNADIQIQFRKRSHGDDYPFDGPGIILAHGINLRQVATHEIGHVLGLDHSDVSGAVMYPYYSFSSNFKLADDDIRGIGSLYGQFSVLYFYIF